MSQNQRKTEEDVHEGGGGGGRTCTKGRRHSGTASSRLQMTATGYCCLTFTLREKENERECAAKPLPKKGGKTSKTTNKKEGKSRKVVGVSGDTDGVCTTCGCYRTLPLKKQRGQGRPPRKRKGAIEDLVQAQIEKPPCYLWRRLLKESSLGGREENWGHGNLFA